MSERRGLEWAKQLRETEHEGPSEFMGVRQPEVSKPRIRQQVNDCRPRIRRIVAVIT